tara:strand:- start:740 stop:1264 length:525 start_codon:yes stop_codon:yes gene_type:complete
MDSYDIDRVKAKANLEAVKRVLIKYFCEKGFQESFDRQLYPAIIQDISFAIPAFSTKIEVVPHIVEMDTASDSATLGWNLFVLGNQRMYLGDTSHRNLVTLASEIRNGQLVIPEHCSSAMRTSTPRRVIGFITRVLESKKSGFVDLGMDFAASQFETAKPSMSNQFYTRNSYGT